MTKIKLLNPDGSLHGVYEVYGNPMSTMEWIKINYSSFDFAQLTTLGFKIEEVAEKRRERWVIHYGPQHEALYTKEPKLEVKDSELYHLVELKPGEKILSRDLIIETLQKKGTLSEWNFYQLCKELGFEE